MSKKNFIEFIHLAEYMISHNYPVITSDVTKLAKRLEQLDNEKFKDKIQYEKIEDDK